MFLLSLLIYYYLVYNVLSQTAQKGAKGGFYDKVYSEAGPCRRTDV